MIKLQFQALQTHQSVTVGPAPGFRVSGNFIRRLPDEQVVAHYSRHQWHTGSGHFSRYDCEGPCGVYFMDREGARSETFGPFDRLHVADGTMYTSEKLFAKFVDETVLWHSFELETYWPNLVLCSHPPA